MATQFAWARKEGQAAWTAEMPGNVTLYVAPEHTRGFAGDPKRGTKWRFGASQWDESTRTISRFGRDCWRELASNLAEAQRKAEALYQEAIDIT